MKRLSADDSVHSHVKVGHRQALQFNKNPALFSEAGFLIYKPNKPYILTLHSSLLIRNPAQYFDCTLHGV